MSILHKKQLHSVKGKSKWTQRVETKRTHDERDGVWHLLVSKFWRHKQEASLQDTHGCCHRDCVKVFQSDFCDLENNTDLFRQRFFSPETKCCISVQVHCVATQLVPVLNRFKLTCHMKKTLSSSIGVYIYCSSVKITINISYIIIIPL